MLSASLPQAWPGSRGSAAPRQGVGPACGSPGRVGRLTSSPCLKSSSPRASASPRPPAPPAAAEGPGQRLFLLPLAQLRGGPSLRAPRAAPAAPRGSLASLQLRGQAVPPPRTGAFSEGPPEGPLRPAPRSPACSLPPRLGRSQGFLPVQALLPPSNFYSSLSGASAARPTPKQKGPKGDTPSGTPESSGTSAGCRTADL